MPWFFNKLKRNLISFGKLLRDYWQFRVVAIVSILNTDLITFFLIAFGNFSIPLVISITLPLATTELLIQYWFWGWFRKEIVPGFVTEKLAQDKNLREVVELGKEVKNELEESGHWDLLQIVLKKFSEATNECNRLVKGIKRFGHLLIFLLGSEPLPFGRSVCFIFCGATRWKSGLVVLMLGNVIHVISVALSLHSLFVLPRYIQLLIVLVFLFFIYIFFNKKRASV